MKYFIPHIVLFMYKIIHSLFAIMGTILMVIFYILWEFTFRKEALEWEVRSWRIDTFLQPGTSELPTSIYTWTTAFHYIWGYKPLEHV